jgi:hypothetical protein
MHDTIGRTAVPIMLLVLTLGALGFTGEPSRPQASPAPSIEGTYKLIAAHGTVSGRPASDVGA